MPLEHFKTQILLLHSEQRTLDALSAGFSDSYAVHCATSGTEALNIFGDTPIHVIVSAQNLPGMSGVDALREAKKRSPETIAILLAGNDAGNGLEALVGDQEVFQIVRGEVTSEALENLIDSATKSVRLLALSEASNDTAANVDEPHDDSEHIVMETAENGSFIISDGTGSVPVLKPGQVQIAPNAGGQTVDVLVLTQDEEFLATVRESSRGLHNVHHVVTPKQAEEATRQHSIGVLVTDAAMIGSNIEALTRGLRANVPRLVAIVAGRRDDGELLMDLINRGQVYRFLLKPVSPGRARLAVEASVKRHLEAPDSAFKGKPGALPKAKKPAKPQKPVRAATPAKRPNAPQAPQAPQAPTRSVRPAAQPAAAKPQQPPAARPQTRQEPRIGPTPIGKPPASISTGITGAHRILPDQLNAGLDDAFDEAPSFTETVAGLAVSVGKSLSSAADSVKSKGSPGPGAAAQAEQSGLAKHAKVIGIGIAAAAVVVFALSYFSGDETEAPVPTPETVVDVEPQQQAPAEPVVQETAPSSAPTSGLFNTALEQARDARAIGNVYIPSGQNAVEYYLAALDLEPASTEAREELDQVLADVFNIAERALLENRSTDAGQALRVIFLADPENPRLAFLNAQLAQQEFRQTVVDTRNAIREARFEDAANFLAEAQIMSGADSAEIDALNGELADARSQQRLDDVLQAGAARLNADQLIAPANDNARYYYQLALNSEPGNAAAQQGLITIADKLVLRARIAVDEGNYAVAESLLSEARSLNPNSAELAASLSALQNQRDADAQAAAAAERQEVERQAAAAREAEASRLAAERAAEEQRAAEAQAQAAAEAEAEAANPTPESRPEVAAPLVPEPRPEVAAAAADSATGAESESGTNEAAAFVSISTLERTKYVAPRYPRSAQRRNTSGYVDVAFTVNELGTVEGVEVTDSRPGDLFDGAATNAVEQWEFSPIIENGSAVPKRVAIRLSFALE